MDENFGMEDPTGSENSIFEYYNTVIQEVCFYIDST